MIIIHTNNKNSICHLKSVCKANVNKPIKKKSYFENVVICSECNAVFTGGKKALREHINKAHAIQRSCPYCKKTLKQK